jgi:hypothetical protein
MSMVADTIAIVYVDDYGERLSSELVQEDTLFYSP